MAPRVSAALLKLRVPVRSLLNEGREPKVRMSRRARAGERVLDTTGQPDRSMTSSAGESARNFSHYYSKRAIELLRFASSCFF